MVASDTVVGIVGSVLLVAVMVGVFVYEYNNPVTAEGPGSGGSFRADYPHLAATEDIDADGLANAGDSDLDGDGITNPKDPTIGVTVRISGSTPAPSGPDLPGLPTTPARVVATQPFTVGQGFRHLNGTVTYTSSTPSPAPASPGLSVAIVDAGGAEKARAASSTSGASFTFTFDVQDLATGNYSLQVTQTAPGPATPFSGSIQVHYEGVVEKIVPVKAR